VGASRFVLVAVASTSICAGAAHAQVAASTAEPGHEPGREAEDDEASGSGAAHHALAPADPKARLTWLQGRVAAAFAAQPRLAASRTAVSVIDLSDRAELVARNAIAR